MKWGPRATRPAIFNRLLTIPILFPLTNECRSAGFDDTRAAPSLRAAVGRGARRRLAVVRARPSRGAGAEPREPRRAASSARPPMPKPIRARAGFAPRPPRRSARIGDARASATSRRAGNPPASGAGTTGFDSTNAPRRRPRARSARASQAAPAISRRAGGRAAAQVVPVRPAPQPGTPRRRRRQRRLRAPPLRADHRRRRRAAGRRRRRTPTIRSASGSARFTLWPAIELTGGYDTNPTRGTPARGSVADRRSRPNCKLRSDWQRHALTADIKGTYTA